MFDIISVDEAFLSFDLEFSVVQASHIFEEFSWSCNEEITSGCTRSDRQAIQTNRAVDDTSGPDESVSFDDS